MVILANTINNADKNEFLEIKRITMHPNFKPMNNDNDIAIIKLKKQMIFNNTQSSICLPHPGERLASDDKVKIAGWGRIAEGHRSSEILQKNTVSMVSWRKCKKRINHLTRNMICAGSAGKDACQVINEI